MPWAVASNVEPAVIIAAAAANPMHVVRIVPAPFVGRSPSLTWETQPCRSRCLVRRSVRRQKAALNRAEPLLDHERGGLRRPGAVRARHVQSDWLPVGNCGN